MQMPDIKELIKKNPNVDAEELAEAQRIFEAAEKLEASDSRPRYNLVTPFERTPLRHLGQRKRVHLGRSQTCTSCFP